MEAGSAQHDGDVRAEEGDVGEWCAQRTELEETVSGEDGAGTVEDAAAAWWHEGARGRREEPAFGAFIDFELPVIADVDVVDVSVTECRSLHKGTFEGGVVAESMERKGKLESVQLGAGGFAEHRQSSEGTAGDED